ncbi:MCM DNA helicase complex subunit [Saitoella coloradoensis]
MADLPILQDQAFQDRVRVFQEFLDHQTDEVGRTNYRDAIKRMLNMGERRLVVSLDEIRDYNREYSDGILNQPSDYLPAFDMALKDVVNTVQDPTRHKVTVDTVFYVAFRGSFGDHHVNPRTLRAQHLGKLISLEGIVTRCSLVRPKVVKSVHYCEETKLFHYREYRDQTMTGGNAPATTSIYPTEDADGNPLVTEFGYSTYRDHQTISIQEMPERAPAGQLPRSIDVIMDDDLVDRVKPGDRIQLVGQYRTLGNRNASSSSATFRTLLIANNVMLLSSKAGGGIAQVTITDTDIRNINKISKKRNIFELLAQSLAPSIFGHDHIKKAILLLLLGGMEKNLENGTHIRGDINILMVGDPSTAKSQMLRFVLNTAPLAIATTGRGSSGVGLTAAVTSDKETGERRLEAGAMVLADRGIVCIDEFDKMSDVDRVAIHEVMEQQTVTIAKAGIHTSLNARCSVIAAANPIYGQYDTHKDPHKNIALPDSLLSRFDLLFVVTDEINDARDRAISEHVLRMHRYLAPGKEEGEPVRDGAQQQSLDVGGVEEIELRETPVFEKFNEMLHAGVTLTTGRGANKKKEVLSIPFIKKYIQYAKNRIKPVLTKAASDHIVATYGALRNDEIGANQRKTSPMTARTLETLIRLSTAHAKARLSQRVEEKDAKAAEAILRFALFKEVVEPERRKRRRMDVDGDANESGSSDDDEDGQEAEEDTQATRRSARRGRSTTAQTDVDADAMDVEEEEEQAEPTTSRRPRRTQNTQDDPMEVDEDTQQSWASERSQLESQSQTQTQQDTVQQDVASISTERLGLFRKQLGKLLNSAIFDEEGASPIDELVPEVNKDLTEEEIFTAREARAALDKMSDEGKIYISEDKVYRI